MIQTRDQVRESDTYASSEPNYSEVQQCASHHLSTPALTKLPPEVLKLIWDEFHGPECKGPICKSLLVYHQAVRFDFIRMEGFDALRRLYLVLLLNPGLAAHCRTLEICGGQGQLESSEALFYMGAIFSLLLNMNEVSFFDSPAACDLALNPDFATLAFPQIKSVCVTLDSLNMIHTTQLVSRILPKFKLYPSLKELVFMVNEVQDPATRLRLIRERRANKEVNEQRPVNLPNITSLSLAGKVEFKTAEFLLKALPSLHEFDYCPGKPTGADYIATLKACSSELRILALNNDDEFFQEEEETYHEDHDFIDEHLRRFKHLEKLTLCNANFSRDIFRHLGNPLPLKSLTLAATNVDAVHVEDLKKLIDPDSSCHNSHLKQIFLRIVTGVIGTATAQDNFDRRLGPALQDWEEPAWIEGQLDYEGVKELVQLGEKYGVEICGPTVDALGIQDAFDRERKHWRELRAAFGGAFIE